MTSSSTPAAAEPPTAVVVILHPDGHVEVIDLLTHPEGLRVLVELTADGPGPAVPDNVVRLPAPPVLRALPRLPLASPSGRPVLVEDAAGPGAPRWIEFTPPASTRSSS